MRFDTMGDVSVVLGMQVTRNREEGALTIWQPHYTKSVPETYCMRNATRCTLSESGRSYRSTSGKITF